MERAWKKLRIFWGMGMCALLILHGWPAAPRIEAKASENAGTLQETEPGSESGQEADQPQEPGSQGSDQTQGSGDAAGAGQPQEAAGQGLDQTQSGNGQESAGGQADQPKGPGSQGSDQAQGSEDAAGAGQPQEAAGQGSDQAQGSGSGQESADGQADQPKGSGSQSAGGQTDQKKTGPGWQNVGPGTQPSEITIRMVGDDLIHTSVYEGCRMPDGTYDFNYIFDNIREDIQAADIAIINQETIMIHDPDEYSGYPAFGTPESIGHAIAAAGFDVAAHANNHTMDKGAAAIMNTIHFWKENYPDIRYIGIHESPEESKICYLTRNDITVGLVNYTYGLNGIRRPRGMEFCVDLLSDGGIEEVMREARENCDLLVAVLHVGEEYVYTPTVYEQQQTARFVDLGADIVLCSHPHVLEPFGMITTGSGRTGLVYYSLGNFVSAQGALPRVLGGMADITVKKTVTADGPVTEIVRYDLVPLVTHGQGNHFTTYRLDQYPDEVAAAHNSAAVGLTKDALWGLYHGIMNGTAR